MATAISETTLRQWMARFGPALINLSAGICRDRHQAEEIVQEAFIKLWKNPPEIGEIAYTSWLRKVVTNLSINALNRTKRPQALPEYDTVATAPVSGRSESTPDQIAASADELSRVGGALERLDESKRAILMLRAQENLSYEAIAEHLGVPLGTVMSRLNRARAALLEELEQPSRRRESEAAPTYDIRKYKHA
jgi:RNA polymerase sigma-70 factor (ECF subfamily)